MEGSARERNVVIEFKDRATAVACYESPEYQGAKVIRQNMRKPTSLSSTALPVSTRPRQASDDRSPVDIACGVFDRRTTPTSSLKDQP